MASSWFRLVRRRLGSHAGFYAPTTALICPCKGNERGLEENLLALTRFDYPNYEIYFTLATSLDPALKVIERVKAASQRPVHIVIAGPPADSSEKVYNLQRAVEALPADKFEMLVFTDSDVRLPRGWLTKLVAPLQDARIGATTAYRWIIPSGSGMESLPSCLASAWNGAVATMLGKPSGDFCWGGGTAIRKKTFDDVNVLEAWKGAVSDDFAMTWALEQNAKPIVFCPECLAATLHPWTAAELLEFTNRQILITRIYSPRRWQMGAIVAFELFVDAAVCDLRDSLQHGRRRSLGPTPAPGSRDSVACGHERRDANDCCQRGNPRMEREIAGMELGLSGTGAGGSISIFLEFHYVAGDQGDSLARNSLRACRAQYDAHSQALGLGAASGWTENARWIRPR